MIADTFFPVVGLGSTAILALISLVIQQIITWLVVSVPVWFTSWLWGTLFVATLIETLLAVWFGNTIVLSMWSMFIWESLVPRITGIDSSSMTAWRQKMEHVTPGVIRVSPFAVDAA